MPPEIQPRRHHYRLLLALLAVVVLVYGLQLIYFGLGGGSSRSARTDIPQGFPQDAPAPKPSDYVAAQKGFQYLVMFSDRGFAPATLSIKKGETVRFTNSSATSLQLTLSGTQPAILAHGAYVEQTFTTAGTFPFSDALGHTGIVTVK